METYEKLWMKVYCVRVADTEGDLTTLSKEERKHMALIMRKFELEEQSAVLNIEMSQTKMLV